MRYGVSMLQVVRVHPARFWYRFWIGEEETIWPIESTFTVPIISPSGTISIFYNLTGTMGIGF